MDALLVMLDKEECQRLRKRNWRQRFFFSFWMSMYIAMQLYTNSLSSDMLFYVLIGWFVVLVLFIPLLDTYLPQTKPNAPSIQNIQSECDAMTHRSPLVSFRTILTVGLRQPIIDYIEVTGTSATSAGSSTMRVENNATGIGTPTSGVINQTLTGGLQSVRVGTSTCLELVKYYSATSHVAHMSRTQPSALDGIVNDAEFQDFCNTIDDLLESFEVERRRSSFQDRLTVGGTLAIVVLSLVVSILILSETTNSRLWKVSMKLEFLLTSILSARCEISYGGDGGYTT
jgi:hypothetical protein